MAALDPATGQHLPPNAIQRILYLTPKVHVYAIPPLTSARGYNASDWTVRPAIFMPRLRILETAIPSAAASQQEKVSITILLEDPATGALFAAAPYGHASVVERCLDSSRFFAVRVVGDGGRKATLGVGFEERSDAFDFGVALQDAGKVLGLEALGAGRGADASRSGKAHAGKNDAKKDYSLKEGETITVNIGGNGRRMKTSAPSGGSANATGGLPILPPPPTAAEVRNEMRGSDDARASSASTGPTAEELGFDDGEFGEFQ